MKSVSLLGALLAFALAPYAAFAEMSYSGFELSFVDVDLDNVNVNGDGFEIGGSYELNDKFFLLGEWQDQNLDFGIDGRAIELGAGLHHPLAANLDFVGTLSYIDTQLDVGNVSADDDGLALGGGIRTTFGKTFQLDAMLRYVDYDNAGSDTGIRVNGRWYFTDRMAVLFGTDLNDNADTLRVGFRAEF